MTTQLLIHFHFGRGAQTETLQNRGSAFLQKELFIDYFAYATAPRAIDALPIAKTSFYKRVIPDPDDNSYLLPIHIVLVCR